MNSDPLIYISQEENKYLEIIISQSERIQFRESKNVECNLCFSVLKGESHIYKTIERNLNLCQECNNRISDINLPEARNHIAVYNEIYSKTITITQPNVIPLYNIKIGFCEICYEVEQILVKLNYCNHYCCNDCLSKYVTSNLKTAEKLLCIQKGCEYEINDYLIIQYLSYDEITKWKKFKQTQLCLASCSDASFTLKPYNNLQQNNVYELNNKICCKSCKKQFCKICWTEHKGLCNFEKLFLQYRKKNTIINCPFCNSLGIPDCLNKGWNYPAAYLECYFCKMQFCEKCKCQKQLFEQQDNEQINKCHICKIQTEEYNRFHDYHKKTMILSILLFPFYIIYLCAQCGIGFPLLQIYQVTKWVWEKTINKLLQQHTGLIFVISPFLTVFMLIAVLLIYIISFIPLLAINIKKFFIDR